jgi:hypothetical protein
MIQGVGGIFIMKKFILFGIGLVIFLYSLYEVEILCKFRELTLVPQGFFGNFSIITNHWGLQIGGLLMLWVLQGEFKREEQSPEILDNEIR